jgi:type IV pilus assembly protein PilY1
MKDATMRPQPASRSTFCFLSLSLALAAGLALPLPALAASVALATSPLATSTTSSVQPNLVLLMDNSGSMAWDHLPDDASDGGSAVTWRYGYYGVRSSQCNGVYYNPTTTYEPPVHADGTSYADASFTGAWQDGFNTGAGTVNLNSGFRANQSGVGGNAGGTDSSQTAYYYSYTGTQTTQVQRNYNDTSNTFYAECDSAENAAPGNAVFNLVRLNTNETTTLTVTASAAPTTTLTVTGVTGSAQMNDITVGGVQIMSGTSSACSSTSTCASNIRSRITANGYSATSSGSTITITGPGSAGGLTPVIGVATAGNVQFNPPTAFSNPSVSSITVNGVELLGGIPSSGGTSTSTAASNIAAAISNGYSASASGNVITITGPTSAAFYTPVVTSSGGVTLNTNGPFPDTNAADLTNFANWYSFYRTRILMMKTATGRAFSSLDKKYRVGFIRLSSANDPTVPVDTFWDNSDSTLGPVSNQRSNWYEDVYGTTPNGGTPLRAALADAGKYYAGKLSGFGAGSAKDPMQYSCQQNFTILTTDGYWNGSTTGYALDGSMIGNQDGTAGRPMYDGASATANYTYTYTREQYSRVTTGCPCTTGKHWWQRSCEQQIKDQPEIGTCTSASATAGCTPHNWSHNGSATYPGSCTSGTPPWPGGNSTTTPVQQGAPAATTSTSGGSNDSLADVAMYYYQTDLRTPALGNCTGTPTALAPSGSDTCQNNVFMSGLDQNLQQHMNTFTLALGASGWMNYSPSYLSDSSGDYVSVKLGLTANSAATPPVCTWQADGTVCNWPLPGVSGGSGYIANLDDLWHAAVDGHGAYFSATDPATLSAGLSGALASVNSKVGSAAAAATSTLNPVSGNNYAYVASYTTVAWTGNLESRGINVDTGVVSKAATWCAQDVVAESCPSPGTIVADTSGASVVYNCVTPNSSVCVGGNLVGTDCKVQVATACSGTLDTVVGANTDTRTIYTSDPSTATTVPKLIPFDATYASDPANSGYFSAAHINTMSQWSSLTPAQQTAAAGVNLIDYLRGQWGHEFNRGSVALADQLYRNRSAVLGDALESQPNFIGPPVFSYPYPGYSNFLTTWASRNGTVYMGANDGMMHAFDADTGMELWAYVPSMVIPNMWKLADTGYATEHTNYVNGSAVTSDICSANCTDAATAVWKTILVAGLNGGGRGYYALDVTDPSNPHLLWEFTPSGGRGKVQDDDLGYTYGDPVITRKLDGTWVVLVTSGYDNGTLSANPTINNSPAGSGLGYLYVLDAADGHIISKISTGVGTASTPSGLAKIAAWNNEPGGNTAGYVYGGDLLGNVWRFDINSSTAATIGTGSAFKFATLFSDTAGTQPQPVMTKPVLGTIVRKRVVFIGTGKYLEVSDLTTTQQQTEYAIKDDNATTTLVNPRNTLVQQYLIPNPDGTATRLSSGSPSTSAATAANSVNFFNDRGWFVDFPDSGERVNINSQLVQGTLIVPSIVPSNTVCSPGGYGWLNFFNYETGGSVTAPPGIPLSSAKYDSTIVGINIIYEQGKPMVEVVTSTNPTPQIDPNAGFKGAPAAFTGKRVLWRELTPQ